MLVTVFRSGGQIKKGHEQNTSLYQAKPFRVNAKRAQKRWISGLVTAQHDSHHFEERTG